MLERLDLSRLEVLRPILPLPTWQKAVALIGIFGLLLAAGMVFDWMPMQDDIARVQRDVRAQQHRLARNLRLARDLPRKKQEYARLQKQLRVALSMLPKKSQIPDLLESVTRAGAAAGLEFSVFEPLPETRKQIYAEVPVSLAVTGTFRQLLSFLKRVGELPRIVDVMGLHLKGDGDRLDVSGRAVTYRFVESEKKQARGRRGRR